MEQEQITLKWLRGNTGCLVMSNLYIPVYRLDESSVVLMDSGLPQNAQLVIEALEKAGLRAACVLTSHIHFDHVGAHALLKRKHGAMIYASEYDALALGDLLILKSCVGLDVPETLLRAAFDALAVRPDRTFSCTAPFINIEGVRFQVLPLPGHTPSHFGFATPDGVAYLADAVIKPTDRLPSEFSYKATIDTIRHLPELNYSCFIAAHAGIFDLIDELVEKNLETFHSIADTISSQCEKPLNRNEFPRKAIQALNVHTKEPLLMLNFEANIYRFLCYLVEEQRIKTKVEHGQIILEREAPHSV